METTSEYEISFQDIAARIWRRRGVIAALVLLAGLGAAAWFSILLGFGSKGDLVYFVALKGVENGEYPGGAAFSPNDLKSPEVLRASIETLNLDDSAVDDISRNLLIEHGAPETFGIVMKHRGRINAKGLSAVEIDARMQEFVDELGQATSSSLRLALNPTVIGISTTSAERLLQEIPLQWSRIYAERYRIFDAPGLRSPPAWPNEASLGEPDGMITAINTLKIMKEGLRVMKSDNRVSFLESSSQHTAAELLETLETFESVRFLPLSQAVLSASNPVTETYRRELRLRSRYLESELASYNRMAEGIVRGREESLPESAQSSDGASVTQLQLSGDSLATLIGLADRASNSEFLREIMLRRHEVVKERANTEIELARLDDVIEFSPSKEFVAAIEQQLGELVAEYEALYSRALAKLRTDLSTLYSARAIPVQERSISLLGIGVKMGGVVLAALFLGILTAFALPNGGAAEDSASRPGS